VILKGEYASIMRMRNMVKLSSGCSSALKMEGVETPSCRAASAFDLPTFSRHCFANVANSLSAYIFFIESSGGSVYLLWIMFSLTLTRAIGYEPVYEGQLFFEI